MRGGGWMRKAKASQGYTQRSFFSRGKAWSGDARRPFVSCASRTRNALASHGHRSRLPLTSRGVVPRLCVHFTRSPTYTRTYTPRRSSSSLSSRHIPPFPSVPSRSLVLSLATHFALAIVSEKYIAILAKTTVLAEPVNPGERRGLFDEPFNEFGGG